MWDSDWHTTRGAVVLYGIQYRDLADYKPTCTQASIQTCHVAERSEIIFREMVCSDWIGGNRMYWISEKFETKANNETVKQIVFCEQRGENVSSWKNFSLDKDNQYWLFAP